MLLFYINHLFSSSYVDQFTMPYAESLSAWIKTALKDQIISKQA